MVGPLGRSARSLSKEAVLNSSSSTVGGVADLATAAGVGRCAVFPADVRPDVVIIPELV